MYYLINFLNAWFMIVKDNKIIEIIKTKHGYNPFKIGQRYVMDYQDKILYKDKDFNKVRERAMLEVL